MDTKMRGRWGEAEALGYLRRNGYDPVAMRYATRFGEIDLIVKNRRFIVFAEVKTRKSAKFAEAKEYVDKNKQERIRKTAELWLAENETSLQPRFDVIEIYAPEGIETVNPQINHIEDAF